VFRFISTIKLLQIYLYLQFNVYHDIQTQGKYILPAFAGLLMLVTLYLNKLYQTLLAPRAGIRVNTAIFAVFMALVLYVHMHAMYKYVVPFYYSNAFVDTTPERFSNIDFTNTAIRQSNDLTLLEQGARELKYEVSGYDPWLAIKPISIDTSPDLILVRIRFTNNRANFYQVYWDAGQGMSENTLVKGFAPTGQNTLYQILPVSAIENLRFDFGEPGTEITIEDMSYAALKHKPLIPLLNKLFNVKPGQSSLSSYNRLE